MLPNANKAEKVKLTPAQRVKAFREHKGWTQEQMSAKCGIHRVDISLIERGERPIGLYRAIKLAKMMGIKREKLCPDPVAKKAVAK